MLALRAVKRQEPLGWGSCLVFLAALLLAFAVGGLLLALRGQSALGGLWLLGARAWWVWRDPRGTSGGW